MDGFGETIQEVSPASGTTTYWYDGGGNLSKTVNANGVEVDYVYDAANRRTSMSSPSSISSTYTYDQTSGGNFGVGRLTSASVASDSVGYVYDAQGRIVSESKVIADSGYATPFTVAYGYDANGKVIQITYPSGDVVNLTRTTNGLVTQVTETLVGGSAQPIATNVTYEPFGPLAGLTYGNGLALTRTYDEDYNLTGLETAPASGSPLLNLAFSWQPDGQISGVTDNAGSGRGASYTYTNAGRVSSASGPWGSQSFTYDANGNRSSYATSTAPPIPATAQTYSYNGFNRLQSITQGTETISFAYDYLGRNDWWSTASGAVAFVYDTAGRLLAEHNAATGAMEREYVWADDTLVGIVDNSTGTPTIEAVTTGQIDEPLLVTAADQSVLFNGYLDPYGNQGLLQPGSFAMNLRLPGQYFQGDSGLSKNGSRDYDPSLGQYAQPDPLGIAGGQNLYPYVGGDPLNSSDPLGLQRAGSALGCVGAAEPACLMALGIITASDATHPTVPADEPNASPAVQARTVAEYCKDCKATDTRAEAQAKAYEFARFSPGWGSPVPWKPNFNPPGGDGFYGGPVWADFRRQNWNAPFGEHMPSTGGSVEEHPFGHPDKPGGQNHECPHFVAVNPEGEEAEFPYKPGS